MKYTCGNNSYRKFSSATIRQQGQRMDKAFISVSPTGRRVHTLVTLASDLQQLVRLWFQSTKQVGAVVGFQASKKQQERLSSISKNFGLHLPAQVQIHDVQIFASMCNRRLIGFCRVQNIYPQLFGSPNNTNNRKNKSHLL